MTQSEIAEVFGTSRQVIGNRLKDTNPKKEYIRNMIHFLMKIKIDEYQFILSNSDCESSDIDLLSEKEAAELTGYSIHTLKKWRSIQTGPHYIIGEGKRGRIWYQREDLFAWIKKQGSS